MSYKTNVNQYTDIAIQRYAHEILDPNGQRGTLTEQLIKYWQSKGYHIDHIKPISQCEGYHPAKHCGNPWNLRLIPARKNLSEGARLGTNITLNIHPAWK